LQEARAQVDRLGCAMLGQTPEIAPADKRLYALRDVTATVESIPLIAASIMSKKLAGGANAVILDVKVGRGSFMKSRERAAELARTMVEIGTNAGVRTKAILTDMDSPLGIAVGNAVEVREAIEVLAGKWQGSRLRDLCVQLSARAIHLSGKATSLKDGLNVANEMIDSGAALAKLGELIKAQGGEEGVCQNPNLLPVSRATYEVKSTSSGFVKSIDAEKIGRIAVDMGAGRLRKSDTIDPTVGIVFYVGVGDKVSGRDILAEFEHNNSPRCSEFERAIIAAFEFSDTSVEVRPIIFEEIG
ncbi:MAG: thymidine phosphorylase, partial [Chthonomonadales bacterium]